MFHRWQLLSILALGVVGVLLVPGPGFGQVPASDYYWWRNRYSFPAPSFPPPERRNATQENTAPAYPSYYLPPAGYQAYYPSNPNEAVWGTTRSAMSLGDAVLVNVQVPKGDAEIWFDGSKTRQKGTFRQFLSPPLGPNRSYSYDIQARWADNGRTVNEVRTVHVQPGEQVNVDFNMRASKDQRLAHPNKTAASPGGS